MNTSELVTNNTLSNSTDIFGLVFACLPIVIIFIGLTGNIGAFLVFRLEKDLKKMSSMVILSFVVCTDTASLFTWNIDHFYVHFYGIYYEFLSLFLCRTMVFVQYFSLQSSGFLYALLCVDRYVTVASMPGSFLSRLPFSTPKNAFRWSVSILITIAIINSHILFLNGYVTSPANQSANETTTKNPYLNQNHNDDLNPFHCYMYKNGFLLSPTWDQVETFMYSIIPGAVMILFNLLVIAKTLESDASLRKHDKNAIKKMKKKRQMTFSLLVISFSFIIFTMPSSLFYGFVSLDNTSLFNKIGASLDFFGWFNHASVFITTFFTNMKFRNKVKYFFSRICFRKLKSSPSFSTTFQTSIRTRQNEFKVRETNLSILRVEIVEN